jgi:uncharacterized protein (DUF1501 family)
MHPSLVNLHKWYDSKELLVMHAVASPYRERSHFDAQQLLESGGERPFVLTTGWLGRALQNTGKPAIAMTAAMPLGLRGSDGSSTWTPDKRKSADPDFLVRVAQMYRDDPPLASALVQAMGQQDMAHGGARRAWVCPIWHVKRVCSWQVPKARVWPGWNWVVGTPTATRHPALCVC